MEPTVGGVTFGRSTTPLPVDAVPRPSGRPRIVLIGVGTWCRHLQVELESVSDLDVAVRAPRSVTTLARERADLVVRVGMRPDARTVRGRAFDLAWNRSVPVERSVTYWIGTDVYDTVHDVERHGVVARSFADVGVRVTVADRRANDRFLAAIRAAAVELGVSPR